MFFDSVADKLGGTKVHLFPTSGGSGIQKSFEELKNRIATEGKSTKTDKTDTSLYKKKCSR